MNQLQDHLTSALSSIKIALIEASKWGMDSVELLFNRYYDLFLYRNTYMSLSPERAFIPGSRFKPKTVDAEQTHEENFLLDYGYPTQLKPVPFGFKRSTLQGAVLSSIRQRNK